MTDKTGTEEALAKFDKEIQRIKGASQAAFWEAGLKIIGKSMELVPVVLGNLRGSAYVRNKANTEKQGVSDVDGSIPSDSLPPIGVEIGYYAIYAARMHESAQTWKGKPRIVHEGEEGHADNRGTYWDNGSPKFLEKPVMDNLDLIEQIIRERTEMDKDKTL